MEWKEARERIAAYPSSFILYKRVGLKLLVRPSGMIGYEIQFDNDDEIEAAITWLRERGAYETQGFVGEEAFFART